MLTKGRISIEIQSANEKEVTLSGNHVKGGGSVKKLVSIVEILKFRGTFVPVLSQPSFQRTWLILFQITICHMRKQAENARTEKEFQKASALECFFSQQS